MHPGGLRSHEQCEDMKCLTMSYVQCYHEAMGYPTAPGDMPHFKHGHQRDPEQLGRWVDKVPSMSLTISC